MARRRSIWWFSAVCLTAAAPVCGTDGETEEKRVDDNPRAGLEPIEPAVADRHDLSASLRDVEGGLQEPGDFGAVYPVPGHDGLFMRVQGGLHAVFPQSRYVRWRGVLVPLVPDNAVMYIGRPGLAEIEAWHGAARTTDAPAAAADTSHRIHTRIELRVDESNESNTTQTDSIRRATTKRSDQRGKRVTSPAAPTSIASDTAYRGQRLSALVRRAAAARAKRNQE